MKKVDNLTKVTLRLEAGTTGDHMDLTAADPEYEFIFGIGPAGMCPFEYELVHKAVGEDLAIQVKREASGALFEHLHPPVMNLFEEYDTVYLKIKIIKIEQPENVEIIKALSELAAHHHGCDCGCGS